MQGKIIKQISNDYTVLIDNKLVVCKARGKFRKLGITPLVGDDVLIDLDNNYILEILPRKNSLIRPAIANVTQAIIVTSVEVPEFSSNLLDKLITIIEYNNIRPVIYFSKLDLVSDTEKQKYYAIMEYYTSIGYFVTDNYYDLKEIIKDNVTVLTGQSGAGKSTLLNKLDNSLNIKTDEVSYALGRGKHTTRHTEFLTIFDGLVADTPGFSALDFNELTNTDIRDNFIEFNNYKEYCKYQDCMHNEEQDCYVKKMVKEGKILKSRYENYLNFISKR
jgi:ribosome biogenesis GTPase